MIFNIVRLSILLLLVVNIVFGFYLTSDDNQQFYQLPKERSAENDNEYVWFTRDIQNDDINQDQLRKQQDLVRSKIFDRKKYRFLE